MKKFFNPLFDEQVATSVSSASVKSESSEFKVDNSKVCPKCGQTNVPASLLSGETVMYCTGCRVSLAMPL